MLILVPLKNRHALNVPSKPKINFGTDFDLIFSDINTILNKHKHILLEDEQCKTLFTKSCFRVTNSRGHKNLKE